MSAGQRAFEQKNYTLADQNYREALLQTPQNVELLYNLAVIAIKLQRWPSATELLVNALELKPDFHNARQMLLRIWAETEEFATIETLVVDSSWIGDLSQQQLWSLHHKLLARGHRKSARIMIDQVAAKGATEANTMVRLAEAYRAVGDLKSAVEQLRCAHAKNSKDVALTAELIRTLLDLHLKWKSSELWQEAESILNSALQQRPQDAAQLHFLSGQMAEDLGQRNTALQAYENAFRDQGFIPALSAWVSLSESLESQPRASELEQRLADSSLDASVKAAGYRALGKRAERLKNYTQAFSFFSNANAQEAATRQYDATLVENYVAELQNTYRTVATEISSAAGHTHIKPVFIVGMPRSGTTLLEQLLGGHPEIKAGGEFGYFISLERGAAGLHDRHGKPVRFENVTKRSAAMKDMATEYLELINFGAESSCYIIDKMPFNFFQLGTIRSVFPEAHIVHCQRNPLDVAISCFKEAFDEPLNFSYSLASIWHLIQQHDLIMKHWHTILHPPIHSLHYEKLIADTEGELGKLYEYLQLQLPSQQVVPRAPVTPVAPVRTPSRWQVRQPVYSSAINSWQRYEQALRQAVGDEWVDYWKENYHPR
jgi:tetratricopeptide (TPR) repeat protein